MIRLPSEKDLPPGVHRNLVIKLHELYRRAGFPGIKSISNASIHLGDNCDIISHQGASNILSGKSIPRWNKLEALVLVLAGLDVSRPEPRKIAQEFHTLWVPLIEGTPVSHPAPDHSHNLPAREKSEITSPAPGALEPPAVFTPSRVRRTISTRLKRDLRLEVGGKCPVPHCQSTTIELAHIASIATGGNNSFGNLLFLCPNHHRQYETGGFSEQDMRLIKARLAWSLNRYTHDELIWLGVFSKRGGTHFIHPRRGRISLRTLESDGYIRLVEAGSEDSEESTDTWCLTEIGARLANVWTDSGAPAIDIA